MKKLIVIITIILAVVALGLGVYFAWQKSKEILTPPTTPATGELPGTNGQPSGMSEARLKILSDQPIFDYWVANFAVSTSSVPKTPTSSLPAASGQIFYVNQAGQILKVKDNEDEIIFPDSIENLQSAKASNDGRQVIIKFGDFNSPQFIIFNIENKVQQSLSSNITAVAWSPNSSKIAYLENNATGKSDLVIKNLADSKQKTEKILSLSQKDFDLEWISSEKIILTPKPSALYKSSAWSVDIKKKTLSQLGIENNGLMINWSPTGKLGLEFSNQPESGENSLYLINEQGEIKGVLDFLTLPNKCLMSEPKIYCAIPQNIPPKSVLPDDYLKKAIYFKDFIYQIDINENSFSGIFNESEPVLDIIRLSLSGNQLLFINRYDNKLYNLGL